MSAPLPPAAMPLVGRDRELATLRDALAAALAGRGSLVLIGGEAGIGKTALAEALCSEASEQGATVLVGRCYDLAETPPHGPWAEALARAPRGDRLPAFPLGLTGTTDLQVVGQGALFAAARDSLAALATVQPLVLLLDDLHWSDPASLDLLRFIGRHLSDVPLLLVATYRQDELTRRHPLYQLLPTLVREARAARLDLHRLEESDLRALVCERYGLLSADEDRLVAYVVARSEGNPFFAGELLRALEGERVLRRGAHTWTLGDLAAEGVPPLLRQVIDARIDRLGEAARDLLALAAVIGQEVPLRLWAEVTGTDEDSIIDTIERAVHHRLLSESTDVQEVRFAHALVREALYEGLLATRRRRAHLRVADALLATGAPDPDAVAYHLRLAGDPRAATWLVKAGERAWRAFAWLTAAERHEAALTLLETGDADPRQRAILLMTLAQLRRFDDPGRGVGYLEEAERLAVTAGDATLVAAARFDRGHLRTLAGPLRYGIAEMEEARPLLDDLPPGERARLPALVIQRARGEELYHRGALIYRLAVVGRLREALALADPMVARAPEATARGLAALGNIYAALGQPDLAEGALLDAQHAFDAAGQWVEAYTRRLERLWVAHTYYFDQPARWQPLMAEAELFRARAAGAWAQPIDYTFAPHFLLTRGAWDDAQLLAAQSRAGWIRGLLAHHRGDDAVTVESIRWWLPNGPDTAPGDCPLGIGQLHQRLAADRCLAASDHAGAWSWLAAHDHWLAWSDAVIGRAAGHASWAAYHRATGDLVQAREHAALALTSASEPRQPLALLAAHRCVAEVVFAEASVDEATMHLGTALALADACAAPYERALTLLALAELRIATGDREDAHAALTEARALLEPLGARPALARADALASKLTAADTLAPPTTPSHDLPAGLSAREVEVLRLVAAGLTNAQAAERLFLSPRTVDQHLRSIYNKLSVSSRAAASRWAAEHGLTIEER